MVGVSGGSSAERARHRSRLQLSAGWPLASRRPNDDDDRLRSTAANAAAAAAAAAAALVRRVAFNLPIARQWVALSRVVGVLDSDAVGPAFKSQLSGNSFRQTVHSRRVSVQRTAKLVAAFLRVARVTAGLAESKGSLPPGL